MDPLDRDFDLIVCIEVLEHLASEDAERAVGNLCAHAPRVLFSSTPEDYAEPTHLNVQPAEYWAELFARNSFVRDVDYQAVYIAPWATLFERSDRPLARLVRDYERFSSRLDRENKALRQALGKKEGDLEAARRHATESDAAQRELHASLLDVTTELASVKDTQLWKAADWARRAAVSLFPADTRRGRALGKARGSLRNRDG